MKVLIASIMALFSSFAFSQSSAALVPKQAFSVFSINNVNLLQKISLDELVKYEFMEELQQELFDGSTSGKTLKDSGIDFDQKLNIFFGRDDAFEVAGFSFGIDNTTQLFEVFDDFQKSESNYSGVDFYVSYFNRIAVKGNTGVLFRVTPNMETVNAMTDSIWYARGNDWPWSELDETLEIIEGLGKPEEVGPDPEAIEFFDEMEIEENTSTPIENKELPVADEDPTEKTYYELLDSVELVLQEQYLKAVCDDLFQNGDNLLSNSPQFKEQIAHTSESVFFLDNSKTFRKTNDFSFVQSLYPGFYRSLEELYTGNVILGDLFINENSVNLKLNAQYGEELGSVYASMTDTKFDKNVFKYISEDNSAFFTYHVNLRQAYDQMYDIFHPLLEKEAEKSYSFSSRLMLMELLDELMNKDAIFGTYKGSMFGTYDGIQKVKTQKFVFDYDEETFEYTEKEVEAEEDMPIFTLGFSTERTEIPEIILRHAERTEESCRKEGEYWVFDKAILNAAPMYITVQNGLFIVTNNESLVKNHIDGYGSKSLDKSLMKKAKKSGFIYGHADLSKAIENVPRELFDDEENEMMDVIRGKSGRVEFSSSQTSNRETSFDLVYDFTDVQDDAGTYILDLINSLYVISK